MCYNVSMILKQHQHRDIVVSWSLMWGEFRVRLDGQKCCWPAIVTVDGEVTAQTLILLFNQKKHVPKEYNSDLWVEFKGFEDEAHRSSSSHRRKRIKLKPSGMERNIARAQSSQVWEDSERLREETFTSAPPAPVALKGELDSQKVTHTDAPTFSEVLKAKFWCLVNFAVFFLFLSAVWFLCDAAVEVIKTGVWIKPSLPSASAAHPQPQWKNSFDSAMMC